MPEKQGCDESLPDVVWRPSRALLAENGFAMPVSCSHLFHRTTPGHEETGRAICRNHLGTGDSLRLHLTCRHLQTGEDEPASTLVSDTSNTNARLGRISGRRTGPPTSTSLASMTCSMSSVCRTTGLTPELRPLWRTPTSPRPSSAAFWTSFAPSATAKARRPQTLAVSDHPSQQTAG